MRSFTFFFWVYQSVGLVHSMPTCARGPELNGFEMKRSVLLSEGRSGSSVILSAITKLCNSAQNPRKSHEIFGSNRKEIVALQDPVASMNLFYGQFCNISSQPNLAMFKWKPLLFELAKYQRALDYLMNNGIKVVYSTRNPLDVYLSQQKHKKVTKLSAHCKGRIFYSSVTIF